MNVIAQLEFELAHFEIAVHHFRPTKDFNKFAAIQTSVENHQLK